MKAIRRTAIIAVLGLFFVSLQSAVVAEAQTGLVAAYSFDEGSGTSINDLSGNGNNGTLINGPTWAAGEYGSALSFDGTNDYVSIPDATSLQFGSGPFTVSAWVSMGQVNGNNLFGKFGTSDNGWMVDVSPSGRLEISSQGKIRGKIRGQDS